ncbi:MAG TPA: 2Fe-2S iron-sulfur cluster-binding protein [Novosphingobium sp.]|nr:2Fe-2S iron-sulfur cluster-binding protein [Novosphingobium sp.]HMP55362.1 2Fe-2S iron-sulfur cluster-binding protein [Novosphingobium sp.]
MGTITFTQPDGTSAAISIRPGNTVMEAAVAREVPGIDAQCYGAGVCGTCHVMVAEDVAPLLDPPSQWESDILACLELAGPGSRLACQIRFAEAIDGACFTVPERQDAIA